MAAGRCIYCGGYAAGARCTGHHGGDVPSDVPWDIYCTGRDSIHVYYKRRELLPDADHWIGDYNLSVFYKKESLATLSRPSGMRSIYFISAREHEVLWTSDLLRPKWQRRSASSRSVLCDRNFLSHNKGVECK